MSELISSGYTGEITLVAGTDASGKSTFLDQAVFDAIDSQPLVIEPRGTQEIRDFKTSHLLDPITPEFIAYRQRVYMTVHEQLTDSIAQAGSLGRPVLTSASPVITNVAHAAMLEAILEPATPVAEIVDAWLDNPTFIPQRFVLLEAPMAVIRDRIQERQVQDKEEINWGFNSLFYLAQYQKALRGLRCALHSRGMQTFQFDTSTTAPSLIIKTINNDSKK